MNVLYNTLSGMLTLQEHVINKISGIQDTYIKFNQELPTPTDKTLNHVVIITTGQNQGYIYRCDYENSNYVWTDITPSKGTLTGETDPIFVANSGLFALTGDIPTALSELTNDVGYITSSEITIPSSVLEYSLQNQILSTLTAQNTTLFYTNDGDVAIYDTSLNKLIYISNQVISSYIDATTGNELATINVITSFVSEYVTLNAVTQEQDPIFTANSGMFALTSDIIDTYTAIDTASSYIIENYALSSDVNNELTDIRSKITSIFRFKGNVPGTGFPTDAQIGDVYLSGHEEYVCISKPQTGTFQNDWEKLGIDIDLSDYATLEDLADYALSTDVNNLINTTSTTLSTAIQEVIDNSFSGDYEDLTNKPDLFSGDYEDLTNKPDIPEKTSDLINDEGFITSEDLSEVSGNIAGWVENQHYITSSEIPQIDPDTLTGNVRYFDVMPQPATASAQVVIFNGQTSSNYTKGHIYNKQEVQGGTIYNGLHIESERGLSGDFIPSGSTTFVISEDPWTEIEIPKFMRLDGQMEIFFDDGDRDWTISEYNGSDWEYTYYFDNSGEWSSVDQITGLLIGTNECNDLNYEWDTPQRLFNTTINQEQIIVPDGSTTFNWVDITPTGGGTLTGENDPIFTANSGMFALSSEIPLSTSQLINDSGFITGNVIQSLLFKVPDLTSSLNAYVHFKIEFSNTDDFNTITYTLNTSDSNTYTSTNNTINGLKVFTGSQLIGFPTDGLGSAFSKEIIQLDLNITSGQYYKFQWLYGDDESENTLISGRFGYGQINGIINVFDDFNSNGGGSIAEQSDPIFASMSGMFALTSQLFSGNYNDLTNKPELFSGNYNDLDNLPTIPENTSDLNNDSDFITSEDLEDYALSADVPTRTSQLINDAGFITGNIDIDPNSLTGNVRYFDIMPEAQSTSAQVTIYSGQTSGNYSQGHIYKKIIHQSEGGLTLTLTSDSSDTDEVDGDYILSGYKHYDQIYYVIYGDEEPQYYTAYNVNIPIFRKVTDPSYRIEFVLGEMEGDGEWYLYHNNEELYIKHVPEGYIDYENDADSAYGQTMVDDSEWYDINFENTYYIFTTMSQGSSSTEYIWQDITPSGSGGGGGPVDDSYITSANLSSNLLMQGFVPFTTISTFVDNKLSGIEVTIDEILGEGE